MTAVVNVVEGDRLWDDHGLEWTTRRAAWLDEREVRRALRRRPRVVLHGPGQPMVWLDADDVRRWWAGARRSLERRGQYAADPDEHGLTWGAHLWRRDDQRLLGFEAFC